MADKDRDVQESAAPEAAEAETAGAEGAEAEGAGAEEAAAGGEGAGAAPAGTATAEAAQAPRRGAGRKTRVGVVTSAKAQKTVTVSVERTFAHPLYGKRVARTKKYHAHDENDEYREGDVVRIVETRPLSRTKRWRVVELIERPL